MSGGEVRVFRQEAGQESPRMPAWKREILERRKAKGGGAGAGAAEPCPTGSSSRVNGEVTGNGSGPKKDNAASSATGTSRNYTITPASQFFASKRGSTLTSPELSPVKTNKDPWAATGDTHDSAAAAAAAERTGREDGEHENLVLQDSLGPLQENPFMKLEKERKKRQDRDHPTRPVQHILELYGSVPGIRTIRAENIIIIESDPDYFSEEGGLAGSRQNGVSNYSSLNDLLDRRGSAVTEIRAREVVIYDTTLSKSEENLSTLGRPCYEGSFETAEGQGRVSRMLQKFDSNYGKLQPKSRSTENLLDLETSASRPRPRPKPQPDLVPKYVSHPLPGSPVRNLGKTQQSSSPPVFQISQSSKPQASVGDPGGSPQSVSSFRQRFEVSGGRGAAVSPPEEPERPPQVKPARDWESTPVPPKSKVPCSPEARRRTTRAESPAASPSTPPPSPGFEIRPSPRPDLSLVPEGDVQALALANLRLQSRNSFTVIPKRHGTATAAAAVPSSPGNTAPSSPVKPPPSQRAAEAPPAPGVPTPLTPTPSAASSKRKEEKKKREEAVAAAVAVERATRTTKPDAISPASHTTPSSSSSPARSTPRAQAPPPPTPMPPPPPSPPPVEPSVERLPVTNIDDVEVDPSRSPAALSPVVQKRKGNTFTVVPKRKTEPHPPAAQPGSPEPPEPAGGGGGGGASTPASTPSSTPASTPPQAPYAHLGTLLKKRYPAVEEIEVIGGYLSLGRSCLSKTSPTGRKLKISFNESSLHSTYEYPSESSVWESGEEDEEEEDEDEEEGGKRGEEEEPRSIVGRIHIPRPSFSSSTTHTNNSSDLSNYTPKHTVDYNTWQEHKLDDPVYQGDANSQRTQMSEEVMLTPADSSSLSDFSSEPALYF